MTTVITFFSLNHIALRENKLTSFLCFFERITMPVEEGLLELVGNRIRIVVMWSLQNLHTAQLFANAQTPF